MNIIKEINNVKNQKIQNNLPQKKPIIQTEKSTGKKLSIKEKTIEKKEIKSKETIAKTKKKEKEKEEKIITGFVFPQKKPSIYRASVEEVKKSSILKQKDFERAKKKMYGQLVRSFETPEACVSIMDAARQLGAPSPFDYVEALQTLTQVEVLERWKEGLGHLCGGVAHIFPLGIHNGEQQ